MPSLRSGNLPTGSIKLPRMQAPCSLRAQRYGTQPSLLFLRVQPVRSQPLRGTGERCPFSPPFGRAQGHCFIAYGLHQVTNDSTRYALPSVAQSAWRARPTCSLRSRWVRPAPRVVGRCRRCRSSNIVRLVLSACALPLAHLYWFPCVFGALPRSRLARLSVVAAQAPPSFALATRPARALWLLATLAPSLRSGYGTAVLRTGSAPSLRSVAPPVLSFLPSLRSGFRFPSPRRSLRSLRWGVTHRSGCDPRCALPSVGAAGALAGLAALARSLSRRQVWLRPFVRLWCPSGSCGASIISPTGSSPSLRSGAIVVAPLPQKYISDVKLC